MASRQGEHGRAAKGGGGAGLIGGAVLSIFMLITTAARGGDLWQAMKGAGAPFLGEAANQPGFAFGPVVVGVLSHFAVSIAWAVLFALLVYGYRRAATVGLGALSGIVVWLGMFYVVLPILGLSAIAQSMSVGMAIFEHVLFGVAVGLGFLPFQHERPVQVAPATRATEDRAYRPDDRRPPEARP